MKNPSKAALVESTNLGESEDLLMEARFILDFLEEAACYAGEAEHAIHETAGLVYILRDIKAKTDKALQIIGAYKEEKKGACQP